jgi:predicted permease
MFSRGEMARRELEWSSPRRRTSSLFPGEFFPVLGVRPILGRAFTPDEDRAPGANPVGVISCGFWQREFGGQRNAIGRTIRVGQGTFQILGVAPEGFHGMVVGADVDFWIPITMQQQVLPGRDYLKPVDTLWLQVMGRLAHGMPAQTAQAGINVTFQQILAGWASALPTAAQRRAMLDQKIELREGARGASELRDQFRDPLLLLMGMVGLVLLIACANIANLMLARASGRQREIGVRVALGAGRARLVRQLLTESIFVAVLGGMLGFLLAAWGSHILLALVSGGTFNFAMEVPRDYRVLLFTAAISLLTGILFGLAPAIRATRLDVNRTLSANARGSIGGRGRLQTGRLLVVAQVALSLLLLLGATLFVRSLRNMLAQKLGYDRDHILLVRIDPVTAGYKGAGGERALHQVARAVAGDSRRERRHAFKLFPLLRRFRRSDLD